MNDTKKLSVYDICEISIMVALALILDKLKIHIGSTGGSINLCAVPLVILGCRKGFIKGLIGTSLVFAFLSCILDGYGIQFIFFDYILAFSGYSLVGLFYYHCFKNFKKPVLKLSVSITLGMVGAFITRMVGHTLSSMIFYEYDLVPALIYNVVYVGFSILSSLVVCLALTKPVILINEKFSKKYS